MPGDFQRAMSFDGRDAGGSMLRERSRFRIEHDQRSIWSATRPRSNAWRLCALSPSAGGEPGR